jgi:hypothetical protein
MILEAHQISPRAFPRGRLTRVQRMGLTYQRALGKALKAKLKGATITPVPWYEYLQHNSDGTLKQSICSPDFIIENNGVGIVVEVKLTFVWDAIEKLNNLYLPIIKFTRQDLRHIAPLVITRTLTPTAPPTITRISQALDVNRNVVPILQWLDKRSPLIW